jgi:hypothetical protein
VASAHMKKLISNKGQQSKCQNFNIDSIVNNRKQSMCYAHSTKVSASSRRSTWVTYDSIFLMILLKGKLCHKFCSYQSSLFPNDGATLPIMITVHNEGATLHISITLVCYFRSDELGRHNL